MRESKHWEKVAAELFRPETNPFVGAYSERSLAILLRDQGRCVYCEIDLMENRQLAYHFVSYDHLLPKHKYDKLASDINNLVLSCRACNGPKRRWDPNEDGKIYDGQAQLSDQQREQLILRVKEHFKEANAARNAKYAREHGLILTAINE
jgi:HNH endonuclease